MTKKKYSAVLPAVRMLVSDDQVRILTFCADKDEKALSGEVLNVEEKEDAGELIQACKDALAQWGKGSLEWINFKGWGKVKLSIPENRGRVAGKIAVVTGGAQGFGGGIVDFLFQEGAYVIIADLNEEKGKEKANLLNQQGRTNRAFFVKADVSKADSVSELIEETVREFGGLDVFISNAGILKAGGLDEMTPEIFELMTKVNYTGYFLCAKYASAAMKLQNSYRKGYYTDIIQINSKSGLKGSNKNFTYAGGKFGGIGLTESFALELMPSAIKVNSICPGNFFDGPLWNDPNNGLFVQYLKAGKVPGAKTVADVKSYYEAQVPAGRGCTPLDVVRAIYYVIEQEYETGQAVPVTGGQNMLK
ncbi:MAG: SDR family NAD(P)-dependent oxidoreductase [Bacteroidota bacterium]|nr:SDR family NAD(P)-dependent oxidoreductase [Bacteroidota bacterium]MDP4204644.1 SDR family NAD(P)-dependent oxidoreductase [Bacteroidota bacterium]